MDHNNLLTAKDLVNALGAIDPDLRVTVHAINHWINLGILPIKRRIGRTRYFSKECALAVARRIRDLQNENLPLNVIARTIKKNEIETCKD